MAETSSYLSDAFEKSGGSSACNQHRKLYQPVQLFIVGIKFNNNEKYIWHTGKARKLLN